MPNKLYHSLIDFLVVVGSDQETGLVLNSDFKKENFTVEDCVFETFILSVLSSDVAYYPNSALKFNLEYTNLTPNGDAHENFDAEQKRKSLVRRPTMKNFDMPIQADILQNLPQFCFPKGLMIQKANDEPTIHSFVLTDIEGSKKYAMVLNFFREFYCCEKEKDEENEDLSLNSMTDFQLIDTNNEEETEAHKNYFLVYVPTSIVLVSKFSYFSVLKECISSIYSEVSKNAVNFTKIIEKYAMNLTHMPVSPRSMKRFSLFLEFSLPAKDVLITNQDGYGFEVFDITLSLIFQRISIDNILEIILAILAEAKIIFISQHTGLLTPSIQCFLKLIQPFKWCLPFVPFLPSSQIEYIEAPHPFIMGCNPNENIELNEANGLFIVDLDNDSIRYPNSEKFFAFPENELQTLKEELVKIDFDVVQTRKFTTASKMDLKSSEYSEKYLILELNSKISDIFLDFFVRIYGDLYPYFKQQTKTFNKKAYLESMSEQNYEFYNQVLETAMFDIFINELIKSTLEKQSNIYIDRLNRLINHGSVLSRRESLEIPMDPNEQMTNQKNLSSYLSSYFKKPINKVLKLPNFVECKYGGYEIVELLTKELENANYLSYKDCLFYLRGIYNLFLNKSIEAFTDFYSIESVNLFPKQLIQDEIYPNLTPVQKRLLQCQEFFTSCPDYKKIYEEKTSQILTSLNSIDVENDYELIEDLSLNGFKKRLEHLEIRIEPKMIERLFNALTLEEIDEYDLETFEIFLEIYQSKEEELKRINKYLPKRALRSIEFALKISSRQNFPGLGIGIVILTQHNLYFLEQGINKIQALTELKNIIAIEKTFYKSNLFNTKAALKILSVDSVDYSKTETFYLCVENEVNVWYTLIQELCFAIKFSKQLVDKTLIQYAAKNVLLIDAILASGLNLSTTHSKNLTKAASYLCYFSNLKDQSPRRFPSEDTQALRFRINPSSREAEHLSIESIIYVDIQEYPTVWCAIGNRIRIYDAITWDEQSSDLKTNDRIVCLCHDVNESKVWIGTNDKSLYVVDVLSREFIRKIDRHTDNIVSISLFKKQHWILSVSKNGEIFVWDAKNLSCIQSSFESRTSQTLVAFTTSKSYLLKCLLQGIEIYEENMSLCKALHFKITSSDSEQNQKISCFCVSDNAQNGELIWAGNGKNGIICVWSLLDFELKIRIAVECLGLSCLLSLDEKVWAGSNDGKISELCTKSFECEKILEAHKDSVKALCGSINKGFLVSGSDSKDGTIAVWHLSNGSRRSICLSLKKLLSDQNN